MPEQDQLATLGYKIIMAILAFLIIIYVGKPLIGLTLGLTGSTSACTLCDPLTKTVIETVFAILVTFIMIYKAIEVFSKNG